VVRLDRRSSTFEFPLDGGQRDAIDLDIRDTAHAVVEDDLRVEDFGWSSNPSIHGVAKAAACRGIEESGNQGE
jgi:hypothetical protein